MSVLDGSEYFWKSVNRVVNVIIVNPVDGLTAIRVGIQGFSYKFANSS